MLPGDLITVSDFGMQAIRSAVSDAIGLYHWLSSSQFAVNPTLFAGVLKGKIIHLAFFEPSTRTRVSFETAALFLGASAINFGGDATSIVKGESLEDTAATLEAMNPALMVVRHPHTGAAAKLAEYLACSVVNAGDGRGHHPSQALLDAATVHSEIPVWDESKDEAIPQGLSKETRGAPREFRRLNVVIAGDIKNSRVARSNAQLWSMLGHKVILVGPPQLLPRVAPYPNVELSTNIDEFLPSADVLMMLRIQKERTIAGDSNFSGFRAIYGLTEQRLRMLRESALILHPGPCNRGVEVDDRVYSDIRCRIRQQVRFGGCTFWQSFLARSNTNRQAVDHFSLSRSQV